MAISAVLANVQAKYKKIYNCKRPDIQGKESFAKAYWIYL